MPLFSYNTKNTKPDPIWEANYKSCKEFMDKYELFTALAGYQLQDKSQRDREVSFEERQQYGMCYNLVHNRTTR